MKNIALGCLANKLIIHRINKVGGSFSLVPLCSRRKRNTHTFLKVFQAVQGQSASIPQDGHHCHCTGIIISAGFIIRCLA